MANQLERTKLRLGAAVVLLLPLGLWALLWLGIGPGDIRNVFDPENPAQFLRGLRVALPFVAAWLAVLVMLSKFSQRGTGSLFFSSPLALAAVYGLVGIGAALLSPQPTVALNWAALYLTVPLVLWAAMWGPNSLRQVHRIIQFNWLIIGLAFAALFVVGLIEVGLWTAILHPSDLLRCDVSKDWYHPTSGIIRSTGVGRFAALTGIIAVSLLWRGNLRVLWGLILLASVALLLTTGARTAIVGFIAAAPIVVLLLGGRKAILGGVIALAIFLPLVWTTGTGETFLRACILKGYSSVGVSYLNIQTPNPSTDQSSSQPSAGGTSQLRAESADESESLVPEGFYTLNGRTLIWSAGWEFIKLSPVAGYGFHADRLVLGTHMHNAAMHALIQTGFVGTIPFLGALLFVWFLLLKTLRKLNRLAPTHKTLVIQAAGILVFLSIRALPESTGAFFSIDWLLLGPLLLYLRIVNADSPSGAVDP